MLGPVVSRGSAADGLGRSRTAHLSHGNRLRVERHSRRTATSEKGMADRSTRTCRGQRVASGGSEQSRPRARSLWPYKRNNVLGNIVRGRTTRRDPLRGIVHRGRKHSDRARPRPQRTSAPLVAVPERQENRGIWRHNKEIRPAHQASPHFANFIRHRFHFANFKQPK